MNDEVVVGIVAAIMFILGLALGDIINNPNSDCEKYGKYANSKYMMICEKR